VEETITEDVDEAFHLCHACARRLLSFSLRPLEWFNLAAMHHHEEYLLHGDFYGQDGAAMGFVEVEDAELYPAPTFAEARRDLERLIDYALTRYELGKKVFRAFKDYPPDAILDALRRRYRTATCGYIKVCLFELCAKVLGRRGERFIRERAQSGEPYSHLFVLALAECLPPEEGFDIAAASLRSVTPQELPWARNSLALFRTSKALDWIEHKFQTSDAIPTEDWGRLAAMSQLTWDRANRWLDSGYPLSFVAVTALNYCWNYDIPSLREARPKLRDAPDVEVIRRRLEAYGKTAEASHVLGTLLSVLAHIHEVSA
jgi:hypothetical protein